MPAVEVPPVEAPELTLVDVAPVPEPTPARAATPAPPDTADIHLPAAIENPLADIRDDVDMQVLAISSRRPRSSIRKPANRCAGGAAVRTIARRAAAPAHVAYIKGSARMAGAMRLGELTHLMESRLLHGDSPVAATPDLFEALDADLDHIAFVLDALREGRTNVELPEFAPLRTHRSPPSPRL